MNILVKNLTGIFLSFNLSEDASVDDLKASICQHEDL